MPVTLVDFSGEHDGEPPPRREPSERLRWIAKYVVEELLERGGQIDEREIGPLLREADRDYRRHSYA